MNSKDKITYISNWIKDYALSINKNPTTLVIGVSGGVDSALTSTLCALTGLKTIAVSMPIKQNSSQHDLSLRHLDFLKKKFPNVETKIIKLDNIVAPGASKFCETVLAYEFKDGINKYLSQLDESVQIKNLEDVISATTGDSIEMRYFNLKRLENAQQKSTLEDEEYKQALEAMLSAFRENGIDKVMDQNNLDAN